MSQWGVGYLERASGPGAQENATWATPHWHWIHPHFHSHSVQCTVWFTLRLALWPMDYLASKCLEIFLLYFCYWFLVWLHCCWRAYFIQLQLLKMYWCLFDGVGYGLHWYVPWLLEQIFCCCRVIVLEILVRSYPLIASQSYFIALLISPVIILSVVEKGGWKFPTTIVDWSISPLNVLLN